jgi:hypothetical protein
MNDGTKVEGPISKGSERTWYSHLSKKAYPLIGDRLQAGITYDPGTVDAEIILEEMFGYAWPQYALFDNMRVHTEDKIRFTARVATKFTGQEKIDRLVESTVTQSTYADVDFALWKNSCHVAKADESMLEASHPIMNLDIENASRDISRMRDSQIVTAIEAATNSSAGSSWCDMTTAPYNDNDPWTDVDTAVVAIEDTNGWSTDVMYFTRKGWSCFARNTYVKDVVDIQYVNIGDNVDQAASRVFYLTHKAIGTQLKVVISTLMTAGEAILQDSTAPGFMIGKGPTIAEKYRVPTKAMDGYIVWDYLEPKEVVAGAAYELTGLHS